ncbi:hypothetical protein D9757_005854 [Collybiopsis confluens]|uniref:C2H2-type domain-containing protein n=1 Tax=Collybiopsis confluens TaxID=2823264 RepID=A0A8H5M9Q9_9AGAR|nr:hypothetical protein D9757_005854 [Collybiopsis confluens]
MDETTRRRKRQRVKNLFILDEAEAGDDESEEEIEEDEPEKDEEFQQELSRFRQHQNALQSRNSPTIFSDLIQRLESNVPHVRRGQDTASSSLDPLECSEHDSGDLGQPFYNALEANLLRHPEASNLSSRYLRGSEKKIIRRIQSDIVEYDQRHTNEQLGRVIQDVLPSMAPGHLYLITRNDVNTIPLCQYLHSFSGFIYGKSIINRKSDFMPIHHVVTDFSPTSPNIDPNFSVGDWVTIRGAGLYTACLGLIVPRDSRLSHSRRSSYTVLTIPRIPKSIEEEKAAFTSDFKPPPSPFFYADALRISELYRLEKNDFWGDAGIPEWGEEIQSQCPPNISCTKDHSTEFFFRGQIFQCGLTLLSFRANQLQAAPTSFDPSIENDFINSHHSDVFRFSRNMPIPNSWSFTANEKVSVHTSCPEKHLHGANGLIVQVLDCECEVDFQGEVYSILKRDLIKVFSMGDLVYCEGGSGSFVLMTGHSALVMIDERTRSVLENEKRERVKDLLLRGGYSSKDLETPEYMEGADFTVEPVAVYPVNSLSGSSTVLSSSSFANSSRVDAPQPENTSSAVATRIPRSIWIGTRVIVKKHATRHGYKGIVVDVRRDDSTLSGLAVQVNYDVINVEHGVEWLDYVQVRNEQSLQFLHEARNTGLTDYYHFKNKFSPSYSDLEKQAILRFKTLARARELDARVREADILEQQEEVRQLYEISIPPPDRWILDPRWQLSLGKLEFFIQVHAGKWKSSEDRKVHLVVKDGRIEVRIRLGATNTRDKAETIPHADICNVPADCLRTKKVSARASHARCLYLVAFPHNSSARHVGKLVHMSQELTKQGNILMYNIRLKYGGQTIPADKTSGDSAIVIPETSTNLASNSMGAFTTMAKSFTCHVCKKSFKMRSSLFSHRTQSKGCNKPPRLTETALRRFGKLPRLANSVDVADPGVEQEVIQPEVENQRTPSPIPCEPFPPRALPQPAAPPPPSRIALRPSRSGRIRFLPAQLRDSLPTLSRAMPGTFQRDEDEGLQDVPPRPPSPIRSPSPERSPTPDPVFKEVQSSIDHFGMYRVYSELPSAIPDEEVLIEDVCEGAGFSIPPPTDSSSIFSSVIKVQSHLNDKIFAPFLNITVYRLISWWYGTESKSMADLDRLVKDVIHPDDFDPSHLDDFSTKKVLRDMDLYQGDTRLFPAEDGWQEISVEIPVPCTGVKQPESEAPRYTVNGVFIRKPLEVMKSVFQSSTSHKFHYTPFELRQQSLPGSDKSSRLYGELYNSPAFIDEHKRVQSERLKKRYNTPTDEDLKHPSALAGMMFWSDATRVGNWGDASMWPIYMYFGNQSKYDRSRPSSFAAHHVAYIPKVCLNRDT